MDWQSHVEQLQANLHNLSVQDGAGISLEQNDAFACWQEETQSIREARRTMYLIGNGASASMASHFAADLAKNVHVHTEVFSDLSLMTAIANDISYEEVFAEPLRRRMTEGDMLVAISSSGQSANILRAVDQAKALGGRVVTLSAMKSGNRLRAQGWLNFYVPAATYGLAETGHAAILHHWIDCMTSLPVQEETQGTIRVVEI